MTTLAFLWRAARPLIAGVALLSLLGTAVNGSLVAVLHRALHAEPDARVTLALVFLGLAVGKAVIGYVSGRMLHGFAQESITELRRELIRKLLAVPYARIEQVGAPRIHAVLTHDVGTVNAALLSVPTAVVQVGVLAGGAGYLLYLHWPTFVAVMIAASAGAALHHRLGLRARALWARQREQHDRLYNHYRALTEGARELKMNAQRRRDFLEQAVLETTEAALQYDIEGNARFLLGQAVNSLLVLSMLALVLLAAPPEAATGGVGELATGFVLTGLYLLGPLSALLRMLPLHSRAQIALSRIDAVGVELRGRAEREQTTRTPRRTEFESIALRDVTYHYADGAERDAATFVLGPLSLSIHPGELVFVTGGNGSGKSTLAKLLTGLYAPEQGVLACDGEAIDDETRDGYRQLWSTVFSEFHLFERLYGLGTAAHSSRAQRLLHELGLSEVVRLREGALSTTQLSRGQRKRLALFTALLEDRPAYLFDEWAADQDPEFKETFYRRIVDDLRRRGKTVIVVTHDERYFGVAERILTLRAGKLTEIRSVRPNSSQSATEKKLGSV